MTYSVEVLEEAVVDLEKLTSAAQDRILRKIQWLAENFETLTPLGLSGSLSGLFKLRVGDYRVMYSFDTDAKRIVVRQVGHRRNIYL